jgi:MFS family permease
MFRGLRGIWPLLVGIALLALGNGLQGSLVGILAAVADFSTTTTGIIMSGYFAGVLASAFITPRIVSQVGHIRVFAAYASVVSTAVLLIPIWVNPFWWLAMRVMAGFCVAGLSIVTESWLNASSTNENRGQLLSVYMTIYYGAIGAGQVLLNIDDPSGFVRFIVVSAILSLSLVPTSLVRTEAPPIERPRPVALSDLYRASPLAVVATFANGLGQSAFFSMGPVYGIMQGLSLPLVSIMLALPPLGVIFSQYPIGALSDRYDRRRVLTVAAFAAAILALVAIPAAAYSQTSLIALYTAFGAISIPIYALALAHANDHLQRDQMLGASSKLVLVYGSGAIAGPSLAGGGMTELGPQGFMTYMIVVYGGLGLFAVYRMMRRAAPSPTEGARLPQVVPTTTPVAAAAIAEEMGESLSK